MITKKELVDKLKKWNQEECSTWFISNWACSCVYREESFENESVERVVDMLSFIGDSSDEYNLTSEEYLGISQLKSLPEIDAFLEQVDLKEFDLSRVFPTKEEFIKAIKSNCWLSHLSETDKKEYFQKISFDLLPFKNETVYKNQEIFWLRFSENGVIYNELKDGSIFDNKGNFNFIKNLGPITEFTSEDEDNDGFQEKLSFVLSDKNIEIVIKHRDGLEGSLSSSEILLDFLEQMSKSIEAATEWRLIYSDSYLELGDVLCLILIKKERLEDGYRSGIIRPNGEVTCRELL